MPFVRHHTGVDAAGCFDNGDLMDAGTLRPAVHACDPSMSLRPLGLWLNKPLHPVSREITYLSQPEAVSMGDAWCDITSTRPKWRML